MAHLLSSGPFGVHEPSADQWLRSLNNRNVLPLQSYLKIVGAEIIYTSQSISLTQNSQARPWPKSIFY